MQAFEPLLIRAKRIDNKVFITVNDNGNGIPKKSVDKIFQPFFTTKPTGGGTGLGLSSDTILSRHMVVNSKWRQKKGKELSL